MKKLGLAGLVRLLVIASTLAALSLTSFDAFSGPKDTPKLSCLGRIKGKVGQQIGWSYLSPVSSFKYWAEKLPKGLAFTNGVLKGAPVQAGYSTSTFCANNGPGTVTTCCSTVFDIASK